MHLSLGCAMAVIFLLGVSTLQGEEINLLWKGEVRVRGEIDGRDFSNQTPANTYTQLRSRLGVLVTPTTGTHLFLQIQDSRVFGGEYSTLANTQNVDLHQGFLKLEDLFTEGLNLSLGRMELSYGDERLVGSANFSNVGRSFDGGVVQFMTPSFSVDLFATKTLEYRNPPSIVTPPSVAGENDYGSYFSGLYYVNRSSSDNNIEAYVLHSWNRFQTVHGEDFLSSFTTGAAIRGASSRIRYNIEGAYQLGTKAGLDISAFLVTSMVSFMFSSSAFQSIGVGYDYLSGTAQGSEKDNSFDPLYHTGHKFYGYMDYFVSFPLNTKNRGLQDIIARVDMAFGSTKVQVMGHYFMLAEAWSDSKDLGQEIDVVGTIKVNDHADFELGASAFVLGEVMRTWYEGSDVAWWTYGTARVFF